MYVETTELGYHRASVDLAHVTIPVALLQLANVQTPRAVDDLLRGLATSGHSRSTAGCTGGSGTFVGDRDTRIVRHDPGVDRENGLVRGAQPANLEIAQRGAMQPTFHFLPAWGSIEFDRRYFLMLSICDDVLLLSKDTRQRNYGQ